MSYNLTEEELHEVHNWMPKAEQLVRLGMMPVAKLPYIKRALVAIQTDAFLPLIVRKPFYEFLEELLELALGEPGIYRLIRNKVAANRNDAVSNRYVPEEVHMKNHEQLEEGNRENKDKKNAHALSVGRDGLKRAGIFKKAPHIHAYKALNTWLGREVLKGNDKWMHEGKTINNTQDRRKEQEHDGDGYTWYGNSKENPRKGGYSRDRRKKRHDYPEYDEGAFGSKQDFGHYAKEDIFDLLSDLGIELNEDQLDELSKKTLSSYAQSASDSIEDGDVRGRKGSRRWDHVRQAMRKGAKRPTLKYPKEHDDTPSLEDSGKRLGSYSEETLEEAKTSFKKLLRPNFYKDEKHKANDTETKAIADKAHSKAEVTEGTMEYKPKKITKKESVQAKRDFIAAVWKRKEEKASAPLKNEEFTTEDVDYRKTPLGMLQTLAGMVKMKKKAGGKVATNDRIQATKARNEIRRRKYFGEGLDTTFLDLADALADEGIIINEAQLDELSKRHMAAYIEKSAVDLSSKSDVNGAKGKYSDGTHADLTFKIKKRFSGIQNAAHKLAKEEVEQIDELSKETKASYVKKAEKDHDTRYDKESQKSWEKGKGLKFDKDDIDTKDSHKLDKREKGVKLAKEERDADERAGDKEDRAFKAKYSKDAVDKSIASSNRSGHKIGGKEAKSIHRLLKGRNEEFEQIDELSTEKKEKYIRAASGHGYAQSGNIHNLKSKLDRVKKYKKDNPKHFVAASDKDVKSLTHKIEKRKAGVKKADPKGRSIDYHTKATDRHSEREIKRVYGESLDESYQLRFTAALEKFGVQNFADLDDTSAKDFLAYVDTQNESIVMASKGGNAPMSADIKARVAQDMEKRKAAKEAILQSAKADVANKDIKRKGGLLALPKDYDRDTSQDKKKAGQR